MTERLSLRALNRATLARQHLLPGRVAAPALETIEHLGGMQSQAPLAPYLGLWTRLRDFDPGELAALTESRAVVRLHLMRNTVHLVSARDCLAWRGLFAPLHAAEFSAHFHADGLDRQAVAREAALLLAQQPRTRAQLGQLLAQRWPEVAPTTLAYLATHHIPLCQVPPRGVWGKGGAAAWAPVEAWLGAPLRTEPVDTLVTRYLGAFGPATVADVQLWSGLTRLREVVERSPLRTFSGPAGQTLYDLPDAPRPPEDIPAPPRFLPAYDNLLLSHQDRTRVISGDRKVPLPPGNGLTEGTFLVHGYWHGTWRVHGGTLHVRPFAPLRGLDRDALLTEAARLGAFLAPQGNYEVAIDSDQDS